MSSHTDKPLTIRDTAIPGLDLLLDEQALLDELKARFPNAGLNHLSKQYIRYKPGMNCLVRYELEADAGKTGIYAKAHGHDADLKLAKARQRPAAVTPIGFGRLEIAEHDIVVCAFPNDNKLQLLHRLVIPQQREKLLRRMFPDQRAFHRVEIETLQYKPERRYVVCLHGAGGEQAALKLYTDRGFITAEKICRRLHNARPNLFPHTTGLSRRYKAIASEWVTGDRLSDCYTEPGFDHEWLHKLGQHLAEFHQCTDVPRLAYQRPKQESARLHALAQPINFIAPELARQAHELARNIGRHLMSLSPVRGLIHGDFYAKQVLCTSRGIQLVDYDDVCIGDPAIDIGLFMAHLERDVLRCRLTRERAGTIEDAFRQGYTSATKQPLDPAIHLHTAAGLLQLLHHPFRNCEPDMIERMAKILTACKHHLSCYLYLTEPGNSNNNTSHRQAARVIDPYRVSLDAQMPFLVQATDLDRAASALQHCLTGYSITNKRTTLRAIEVRRHRPGRRCLIEYSGVLHSETSTDKSFSLIGKARARGLDKQTWRLNRFLYKNGFSSDAKDGISVPEPVGCLPEFNMWLQQQVTGETSWSVLSGRNGIAIAQHIADAIYKLHSVNFHISRCHSLHDEILILDKQIASVILAHPEWSERLKNILDASHNMAANLGSRFTVGIHRDFYHDQVIVNKNRLYLLDLDLYCRGDPALDIGNFIAHLQEQSLRERNNLHAMSDITQTIIEHYQERAGREMSTAIDCYRKLTLVRHIAISQRIPGRKHVTGKLVDLCESLLGVKQPPYCNKSLKLGEITCR